jgi:TolB-like protein/Tfp pilus assembly protein PilF
MTVGRTLAFACALSVGLATRIAAQCPDGSPPPCRAVRAALNSVVVLYFDNLSPDTADAFLADGLTEALLFRLGQLPRLAVKRASRAVAKRVRDSIPHYATAIGQLLRVRYVVEGSVRRAGPRVRVSTRLVRAGDGTQIWADEFDRATSDILNLEDELARRVAIGIAGRLAPSDRAALAAAPTRNPDAYVHFLRGNFYLAQRSRTALTRAVEEYAAAARLEPGFTQALGRIGYVYGLFVSYGHAYQGLAADSLLARGLAVSDRAIRQDSASSDAWLARGSLLVQGPTPDYVGAQQAFERALALDRGSAEINHVLGWFLRGIGRDSASTAAYLRAIAIEPIRPITLQALGYGAFLRRDFTDARRWLDSALNFDPALPLALERRALVQLRMGEFAGARVDFETLWSLTRDSAYRSGIETVLALQNVASGDTTAAREHQKRLLPDDVLGQALILTALHHGDEAVDRLERLEGLGLELWGRLREPLFDELRAHPRFQRLMERVRPR